MGFGATPQGLMTSISAFFKVHWSLFFFDLVFHSLLDTTKSRFHILNIFLQFKLNPVNHPTYNLHRKGALFNYFSALCQALQDHINVIYGFNTIR